ncbi:unnamed protein product [Clonostachys byssicola]|uniref:Six-hairpin glycosidase-like protein n=1 Tax=Clonostachys byssicola TaxID=160290 RepID=A0A9N9US13_9HYPO|nr:unnamed protein product [Clonostachys byssicola]
MSSWAWHNDSLPTNGEELSDYTGVPWDTHGRNISYDIPDPNLPQVSQWLIGNPNRINLGRIGLKYKNMSLEAALISNPRQELDVWNGLVTSQFTIDGEDVKVITQGDFDTDSVTFSIQSSLIKNGDLQVELDFPYPPIHTTTYKYEVFAGSYDFPANHTTVGRKNCKAANTAHIYHEMQNTRYYVNLRWPSNSALELSREEPRGSTAVNAHRFTLGATGTQDEWRGPSAEISFTANFSPTRAVADLPEEIRKRNTNGWHQYWNEGGFVDLTESSNWAADELQRRIILSQYHVRVNSAATGQSPQESGLMNNGWYGKFHMEMVVWHHAHWATWGRQKYFDNIFPALYDKLLPSSRARAEAMGWEGARWPKMTELITGVSSPGEVNGLLLWQQPHAMLMASFAYQANSTEQTLQRWDEVVTASADYMASYAWKNVSTGRYDLGPPSYGVTENTPPRATLNLAFEISYWRYGLDVARTWKRLLNQPIPELWTTVAENLAPPPQVDGLYAVYEGLNSTWWDDPKLNADPRSLIMMKGFMPDSPAVDSEIALKTADKVAEVWTDEKIRGWGRPILAINSARVGRPERAVYHLTAYKYWNFDDAVVFELTFRLLVSYMAAGWNGSTTDAPGFPNDGTWTVKHEGLVKSL